MSVGNVLIVEDETDWCDIYERAARREGVSSIKVAHSLAKAQTLIDAMKFAVAFVDIGLDVDDDRNIDGLRVMEKIRSVGDETSIIVVTGRSGRDVLPITRDAIKKYDAFDAVGKVPIEPSDIRRLVRGGLEAYAQVSSAMRTRVSDVLRGDVPGLEWDDRMLNAIKIAGGASGLYKFLDSLVKNFLPLVPRHHGEHVAVDATTGVACGTYWSRAIGDAVAICFGGKADMDRVLKETRSTGNLLGKYEVGPEVAESSMGAVTGVVLPLNAELRENFGN